MSLHADLIGRQIVDANGRTLTVTGIANWSPMYAELENENGTYRTVRNVSLLRLKFADIHA